MEKQTTKPTHRKHHPLHDYRERCVYHVTLVCSERVPLLGRIEGNTIEEARMELSPLGYAVSEELQAIPERCRKKGLNVQLLAKTVMPEHIHFVLFVKEEMNCKLHMVIRGFKQGCNKRLREWMEKAKEWKEGERRDTGDVGNIWGPNGKRNSDGKFGSNSDGKFGFPLGEDAFLRQMASITSPRILTQHALFEPDYDETRLRRKGQLSTMINYVHNNPQHRWLKQHHKDLLMPVRGIMIAGKSYDAIGNVNLLGLPRHQVWVRSRWSDEEKRNYKNNCVLKARHGYALISPFISPHEAAVRDVCLKEGHSIIQLVDNGFSKYTQCPGGLYDYCVNGQVLILVPSDYPHVERKKGISRQECVVLNERASEICEEK